MRTLSGGEQKRLVLEALLRGPDEVLLLDEPDNYLDVPGKRWLEERLRETPKTVLFVSHDRELLARVGDRVVTVEGGRQPAWVHGGGFATYHEARTDAARAARRAAPPLGRGARSKLKALVRMYKQKAAYNDGMASPLPGGADPAARSSRRPGRRRSARRSRTSRCGCAAARTGKRAVICEQLELTGLMKPFDLEIWYGDRVAVLGSNGSGKSHFLRLLAGGSDPDVEHRRRRRDRTGRAHRRARLGARVVPGCFAQTHEHPELVGRTPARHPLARRRPPATGWAASRRPGRCAGTSWRDAAEQPFESLSGGQQARLQILLLELSGATLLLLDEPTDNLDLVSAEALEEGLAAFDGTVVAVTHDRWFARAFDRFLVFGADGEVYESAEPVWDEARVQRAR